MNLDHPRRLFASDLGLGSLSSVRLVIALDHWVANGLIVPVLNHTSAQVEIGVELALVNKGTAYVMRASKASSPRLKPHHLTRVFQDSPIDAVEHLPLIQLLLLSKEKILLPWSPDC